MIFSLINVAILFVLCIRHLSSNFAINNTQEVCKVQTKPQNKQQNQARVSAWCDMSTDELLFH
jgi:hypothetical protein